MILASKIEILKKDGITLSWTKVTQMYTVGNFFTITGDDATGNTTERFKIAELQTMIVWFNNDSQ